MIEKILAVGFFVGIVVRDGIGLDEYDQGILVFGILLGLLYLIANWWLNKPTQTTLRTVVVTGLYGITFSCLTFTLVFKVLFLSGSDEMAFLSLSLAIGSITVDLLTSIGRTRVLDKKSISRLAILIPIVGLYSLVNEDRRIKFTYRQNQDFLKYYELNKSSYSTFVELADGYKYSCEKTIETFDNGKPRTVHFYKNCNDTLIFAHRRLYESGQIATEAWHNPMVEFTEHRWWYENGQLKGSWQEIDGKEHGFVRIWHANGNIREERSMENGVENGIRKLYHENGILSDSGYVDTGNKEGLWITYDSIGRLKFRENWANNSLNGVTRVYAPEGWLMRELNYVDGKQTGAFKSWDSAGTLIQHLMVENDTIAQDLARDN